MKFMTMARLPVKQGAREGLSGCPVEKNKLWQGHKPSKLNR